MTDKLLVVAADASVLEQLGSHFERVGYKVWLEASGEQAMETYRRERPEVVLLDLRLPDENGLALLGRLHGQRAAVILLIERDDSALAVQAMQLGAENFVAKPVDLLHLAAAVSRVAEKVRLSRENSRLRALLEHEPALRQRPSTDRRYQAQSLSEVERQHIERTLRHHGGNRTHAALELGISRATLINKIKAYSLNL
ncbi:MAG TPA: response regulator [Gemmatimonadales bacterium]|nr:response regulator [Gemmatimonadales bacterium]